MPIKKPGEVWEGGMRIRKSDGSLTDAGQSQEDQKISKKRQQSLSGVDRKTLTGYDRYLSDSLNTGNRVLSESQFNASRNNNSGGNRNIPTLSTANNSNFQSIANDLAKAKTNREITNLQKVRDKNIGILDQSIGTTKEAFKEGRTGIKTRAEMNRERFRKSLVPLGQSGGGSQVQGDIAQTATTQGLLGQSQKGEATALTDIDRRKSDILTGFESDVAGVRAGAEAEALERTLEEQQRQEAIAREDRIRQEGFDRQDQQIADALARDSEAMARAEAQGVEEQERNDFLNTISQFGADYQAEIDNIANDADPSNDWKLPFLRTARQQKIANMQAGEATAAEREQEFIQQQHEEAFKAWTAAGEILTEDMADAIGLPIGTLTNNAEYRKAQTALEQGRLDLSRAKENRIGTGGGTSDNFKVLSNGLKQATAIIDSKQQIDDGYGGTTAVNIPAFKQEAQRQQMGGTYIAKAFLNGTIDEAMAEKLSQQEGIDEDSVLTAIKVIQGTENIGNTIKGLFNQ